MAVNLVSLLLLTPPSPAAEASFGLQVDAKGVLVKDGKPYRGIGINFFDAFVRTLLDPKDSSYREGFKVLSEHKIPFVRFACCGFWPRESKLYVEDKEAYFKLLDGVVKAAEEYHVGLIPSLFWHMPTVSDMVGEPMDEWANPKSRTNAFMREYVRDVVTRYKDSPAIWGWECGNERNLAADLPNASEHRPWVYPELGTAKSRSERDDLTHDQVRASLELFAREVRKYDKRRAIFTGNAFPRPSAWHQKKDLSWKQDSEEQYVQMLLGDNPDPTDTLTVHLYKGDSDRFGRLITYDELLDVSMRAAAKARKPLFVGEFGSDTTDREEARKLFYTLLSAVERSQAPIAAPWVYDLKNQENYTITATNERAYQLRAISRANERINRGGR